jgi:MFS family permease
LEFPLSDAISLIPETSSHRSLLYKTYWLEGLGSVGGNLLMFGIFFYMQRRFGWGASRNLPLSSAQGAAYALGALASNPLSRRIDRQKLLRLIHIAMAAVALAGAFAATPPVIVFFLLVYALLSAAQWPLVESLISIGASPAVLSRRISIYNLVWSGTGAATVAACGWVIAHYPQGIFLAAVAVHLAAALSLAKVRPTPHATASVHLDPEPQLVPLRAQAKRLSRIALPATFAVIYTLGAIMPTLSVIQSVSATSATLIASVWMISRWVFFIFLGATVWWHTRPRALLIAATVMLIAFLGITLLASELSMVLWQIALGIAMALIYSSSLYFGMVLSDGATAQNAYHEALIGLGTVLGPGCGALAAHLRPADPHAPIYAIAIILWTSVGVACGVSIKSRK